LLFLQEILPLDTNIQLLGLALTSSCGKDAEKETSNQEKLCNALQNIPIRNKDTTLKRKRKLTGNGETDHWKSVRMCVHDKGDNSDTVVLDKGDESDTATVREKLCSNNVDIQSNPVPDTPYILIVERENKDGRRNSVDTEEKHESTDLCGSSMKTYPSHSTATLFDKLGKSMVHPNVIEAIIKELNQ
jgi:hypothetical protein